MKCIERRIQCDCGCGNEINVELVIREGQDDYDVTVSTICSCFFSKSEGLWFTLKRRLKAAWLMLTGQEFLLHEVILDSREWHALVENLWRDLIGTNGEEKF